jgi:hypothetical protein
MQDMQDVDVDLGDEETCETDIMTRKAYTYAWA